VTRSVTAADAAADEVSAEVTELQSADCDPDCEFVTECVSHLATSPALAGEGPGSCA
jgi:hypothetical protein